MPILGVYCNMPIFDYECHQCGYVKEVFERKYVDDSCSYCPNCKITIGRVFSAPKAFKLIGQGFYKESENRPD